MLIQDVRPISTVSLILELYRRGVTIERIFGMYYEIEAHKEAKYDEMFEPVLTVGDAGLVGLTVLPDQPEERQPF